MSTIVAVGRLLLRWLAEKKTSSLTKNPTVYFPEAKPQNLTVCTVWPFLPCKHHVCRGEGDSLWPLPAAPPAAPTAVLVVTAGGRGAESHSGLFAASDWGSVGAWCITASLQMLCQGGDFPPALREGRKRLHCYEQMQLQHCWGTQARVSHSFHGTAGCFPSVSPPQGTESTLLFLGSVPKPPASSHSPSPRLLNFAAFALPADATPQKMVLMQVSAYPWRGDAALINFSLPHFIWNKHFPCQFFPPLPLHSSSHPKKDWRGIHFQLCRKGKRAKQFTLQPNFSWKMTLRLPSCKCRWNAALLLGRGEGKAKLCPYQYRQLQFPKFNITLH